MNGSKGGEAKLYVVQESKDSYYFDGMRALNSLGFIVLAILLALIFGGVA